MRCQFCGHGKDRVVDSRKSRKENTIRRRRECLGCGRRLTTYERIEEIPLVVVKKGGLRERFKRSKLMLGLSKASEKRPVPTHKLEEIVEAVEQRLLETPDRELTSHEIGAYTMKCLKKSTRLPTYASHQFAMNLRT